MKVTLCTLAGMLLWSTGCATNMQTILPDPVGPHSLAAETKNTHGSLVVYSCWDLSLYDGYHEVIRVPYDVYSSQGQLIQHVYNDTGGYDRYPVTLSLPTGEYKVSSFVPGLGQTTVPVRIRPGQTTPLHLDGSANRLRKQAPATSLVWLPDGDVAGWKASETISTK